MIHTQEYTFRRGCVLLICATTFLIAGCIKPYRVEVQQGNVITPEMLTELKEGMSPGQVRFALGTPLVIDPFHPNRWDYYFGYHPGRLAKQEQRRVTVVFEDEKFVRVEGDLSDPSGTLAAVTESDETRPKKRKKRKGIFGRLWDKIRN